MSIYRLQGLAEKRKGIYYEFDSEDEPLGRGGMGVVYKGRCVDNSNGITREVAVKFLYDDMPSASKAAIIERARREASIQIRHDNLVEMLGFIETESKGVLGESQKHYHVVSELLEGVMLDDLLAGKVTDAYGNVIPFAQKLHQDYLNDSVHFAVFIIRSILSGLMALHDAGYIHRDIDPTNIMVTKKGHVKLIDFGIAKQMNTLTAHDKGLTVSGVFIGKPEYASPELVLGAIDEQNQTTDIYAMGILLFQCIVGHVPFEGERHEILRKQLHEKLPLGLIKNKPIRKIIEKATEKSRSKRFQSSSEFRVAIDNLVPPSPSPWRFKKIVLSSVIGLAVVAGIFRFWPKPEPPIPQEDPIPIVESDAYLDIVNALKCGDPLALNRLSKLSENGDWHATYLLSRLFFEGKRAQDAVPDSIQELQFKLSIEPDNLKAHELLQKAVVQNNCGYEAFYELGCDFFSADKRSDGYEAIKNLDEAHRCFDKALRLAEDAKDMQYIKKSAGMKENLDRAFHN